MVNNWDLWAWNHPWLSCLLVFWLLSTSREAENQLAGLEEVGDQLVTCKGAENQLVGLAMALVGCKEAENQLVGLDEVGNVSSGLQGGWKPASGFGNATSGLQGGLQLTGTTFHSHYYLLRPPTNLQRCPHFYPPTHLPTTLLLLQIQDLIFCFVYNPSAQAICQNMFSV